MWRSEGAVPASQRQKLSGHCLYIFFGTRCRPVQPLHSFCALSDDIQCIIFHLWVYVRTHKKPGTLLC